MLDLNAVVRPGLGRYLACLAYEAFLLLAWLLLVLALLTLLLNVSGLQQADIKTGLSIPSPLVRGLTFIAMLAAGAGYFCFFWARGGQTLAMKTWRLRLVSLNGEAPTVLQALARFLMAAMFMPLLGVTWLWAFGSRDRLWLHDQVSRTVLIRG